MIKISYMQLGVIVVVLAVLYGYFSTRSVTEPEGAQTSEVSKKGEVQLPNPASVHCVEIRNGTTEITDTAQGQVGMCTLPDGRRCEEWELYQTGVCASALEPEQAPPPPPMKGESIDLSGQGLSAVPRNIFDRTNTKILNLSNNNLSGALQAEIRHMKELRSLDLSDNKFTGVPAEVGQLSNLEILDLSNNPITGLPYEIGNLKNLKVLDLRGTNYAIQDLDIIRQGLPASVEIRTDTR